MDTKKNKKASKDAGATYIDANDPDMAAAVAGIPVVGTIYPKPDPVYGHTFKMPDLKPKKNRAREN